MKKYISSTVLATMPFVPLANADATTISIICTPSEACSYTHRITCNSVNKTSTFTAYNGGSITCVCPSDSSKLITYTCNATCQGDGEDVYWSNKGCYSCDAGKFNGGTGCFSCAEYTEKNSATSVAGAVGIENCYVPTGETFTEGDGSTFDFTDICYYTGGFTAPDTSNYGTTSSSS